MSEKLEKPTQTNEYLDQAEVSKIREEVRGLPDTEIQRRIDAYNELKEHGEHFVGRAHVEYSALLRQKLKRKDSEKDFNP